MYHDRTAAMKTAHQNVSIYRFLVSKASLYFRLRVEKEPQGKKDWVLNYKIMVMMTMMMIIIIYYF